MPKKDTDISLIRKYLNGELDARAMHQLEARAQDDPFLMDAIDGYESANRDQQDAISELSERLEQRISQKKQGKIISLRVISIAASVLVVLTIGWLLLINKKPAADKLVDNIVTKPVASPAAAPAIKIDTNAVADIASSESAPPIKHRHTGNLKKLALRDTVTSPVITADNTVIAQANTPSANSDEADSTPLNEMVVMNYTGEKKKEKPDTAATADNIIAEVRPPATVQQTLQSKATGVSKTPALSPFSDRSSQKAIVNGMIVDKVDGRPLQNVTVRANGSRYGAVTDKNGKFSIPADSIKDGVTVSMLGYNTRKVKPKKNDSLASISLSPANNSLSEVVVVRRQPAAARPQTGWQQFKNYLKENAVSPDGRTGNVKLTFLVSAGGTISNLQIVHGLSDATNKKAIDLITDGPSWFGNTNGKPEKVKLTIKF
ncbi:MAG TPA: carboxypeptidase-like regulatory domain-containing protein [Mucilaginibacter sp.]|nr:carboxypeptidase-like regulatory domain-containing protein [Mucilaginibacter sp.]